MPFYQSFRYLGYGYKIGCVRNRIYETNGGLTSVLRFMIFCDILAFVSGSTHVYVRYRSKEMTFISCVTDRQSYFRFYYINIFDTKFKF